MIPGSGRKLRPPHLATGIAISLAVHAAALAAVLKWPTGQAPSSPPETVAVDLVFEAARAEGTMPSPQPPLPTARAGQSPAATLSPPPAPSLPAEGRHVAQSAPDTPPPVEVAHPEPERPIPPAPPPKPALPQVARTSADPEPAPKPAPSAPPPAAEAFDGRAAAVPSAAAAMTAATPPLVAAGNRPPPYPPSARRRGQQGVVVVRVAVAIDGRPATTEILASSGVPALDAAAVDAVRSWRFVPARRGDQQVAGTLDVPIRFDLDG